MQKKELYSELLKDPRWQKRRLEIMQRDNFTCQICGHSDKQLHVHHLCYDKYKMPWEHDDDELITLCEDCHKAEHDSLKRIRKTVKLLTESLLMIEIEAILEAANITVGGMKRADGVLDMLGGYESRPDGEKQDYWGLDYPDDLCKRLSDWRKKTGKYV